VSKPRKQRSFDLFLIYYFEFETFVEAPAFTHGRRRQPTFPCSASVYRQHITLIQMNILGISGSLRANSLNTKLLRIALQHAEGSGAIVSVASIGDLPLYDGDVEDRGFPQQVLRLKAQIEQADLLVIASPEYNASVPGVLKNAIDWASRKNSFDGKTAVIMGASPGPYGTVRMQPHLRQILATLNVHVLPQPQILVRDAAEAFDTHGQLRDPKTEELLKRLVTQSMKCVHAVPVAT
jgi:chromate reductase, NAD(P)H dehydrogenase (quinone)